MGLVIHTIHGNRYVYDHHRVGTHIKSTYLGRAKDILIMDRIPAEGYPVTSPDYPEAHKTADKAELSEYGKFRWDQVERVGEKIPKGELAGSHNGHIVVSKKVPEDLRGQVLYHEKQEKAIMDGSGSKSSDRVKTAMKHNDLPREGAKKRKHLSPDQKFEVVMREYDRGTLRSSSGEHVTDKNQALAIAYSEKRKREEEISM